MTKDIKKKRKIDWIVFWIWALTAICLLENSYMGYRAKEELMGRCETGYTHSTNITSTTDIWSTETTVQKEEHESESIPREQRGEIIQSPYSQERANELLRFRIVVLYMVIVTILFFGIKGRSSVLTVILIVLSPVNVYLWLTHPVTVYLIYR